MQVTACISNQLNALLLCILGYVIVVVSVFHLAYSIIQTKLELVLASDGPKVLVLKSFFGLSSPNCENENIS